MTELEKQAPLRVMIYDTTDNVTHLRQLQALVPEDMDVDFLNDIDLQIPVGLSSSWTVGGGLYKALRWVDVCKGFSDWGAALDWIAALEPGRQISQIQIWGHGSPGRSWMNGRALTAKSLTPGHKYNMVLRQIAERMTDDGVIWFRNCSVFAGQVGRDFGRTWANELDVRIAAHTHVIGVFQSGLHTIGPGEEPRWPADEGIAEGTPDHILKTRNSMPWSPNTVFMLSSGIPRNW